MSPMTDPTRDEAVQPIGYMRPADKDGNSFWCSRQKSAYYTDPVFASAPAPAGWGVDAELMSALKQCVEALRGQHGWAQGRASKRARQVIAKVEAARDDSNDWYSSEQIAEIKRQEAGDV